MPVFIYFGRCLVIWDSVRLDQLANSLLLMARMSMEGNCLNILACRKASKSALVASYWIVLQERFCRLLVVGASGGGFGSRGIVQRMLVR